MEQMQKELIIITGASGLIGERIAARMRDNYTVVGIDLKSPNFELDGFIQCDLTDTQSVQKAFGDLKDKHGSRIASFIHLAAYYDFAGEPSPLYEELTVQGTRRVLETLQSFDVEQFIFSSSLLVMKPCRTGELLTEDSPIEAEWAYPESKVAAEEVIQNYQGTIPAVVLRLGGVYDEAGHSLPVTQQIARIYEKTIESYFFPGNRDHGQAFIHLDDVVTAFECAVERRKDLSQYEVFLIAEPDVMSYGELQDVIGEALHGKEWPTIRIPKVLAKVGAWAKGSLAADEEEFIKPWMVDLADAHYPIDPTRAKIRLGWQAKHRLRETIGEILRRLKENPRSWYKTNKLNYPGDS